MIELLNVKTEYSYGETFSFPKISFEEGKLTTIIGRNGSGKSTLLKTIAGLRPYSGSIKIDGKECRTLPPKERARKIAYLPQTLRNANIDVETLVSHGRYPWHGSLRKLSEKDLLQVEKALEITDMKEYRERSLPELSGGERQRAYLAMVIAQDAPMILLDEPTTFMDMAVQKSFYNILRRLIGEGHGIIMVCHNIEQSFSCSDTVCLLNKRTLEVQCAPDKLIKDEALLRDVFGATFVKTDDERLLYPYAAVK